MTENMLRPMSLPSPVKLSIPKRKGRKHMMIKQILSANLVHEDMVDTLNRAGGLKALLGALTHQEWVIKTYRSVYAGVMPALKRECSALSPSLNFALREGDDVLKSVERDYKVSEGAFIMHHGIRAFLIEASQIIKELEHMIEVNRSLIFENQEIKIANKELRTVLAQKLQKPQKPQKPKDLG